MSRIEAFKIDVKACLNSTDSWNCGDSCHCHRFVDLSTEESTFTCTWLSSKTKRECRISYIASDDYPDNCCVFLVRKGGASTEEMCEPCSLPLVAVLKKLSSELQQEDADEGAGIVKPSKRGYNQDVLNVMSQKSSDPDAAGLDSSDHAHNCDDGSDDRDSDNSTDDNDVDEELLDPIYPIVNRKPGRLKREESEMMHPLLHKDICTFQEFACTLNGADSEKSKARKTCSLLETRFLADLGEVDCFINISLEDLNLSNQLCSAWKLKADEPLVVHLNFDNYFYLDCQHPPRVEVFQSTKYSNSVLPQVQNILKLFLQELWDKKLSSNSALEASVQQAKDPQTSHTYRQFENHPPATNSPIIHRPKRLKTSASVSNIGESANPQAHCSYSQRANPPAHCSYEQAVNSVNADASLSVSGISSHSSDLGNSSLDAKQMPSFEDGFIVMVYKYVCQRLPSLNEFCIICDNPHSSANAFMLMPAVCTRELCVFSYQNLGVMASAEADIATGAQVVDLLITLVRAASFSFRCKYIFDPFPSFVDPEDNTIVVSEKKKNFGLVKDLLTKLPASSDILLSSPQEIHTRLDKIDRLLLPLLTWIIHSNRSHIVRLPTDKQFDFMNTSHQFLLLSSPPDQERYFQEMKIAHGSTFAFHGSPIENWHSIIRKGLVVASGTKYQLNGAAFGKGIYVSPQTQICLGYCENWSSKVVSARGPRKYSDTENFLIGKKFTCMALCEVIQSQKLQQPDNEIWVVTDERHVVTRYFFVWVGNRKPRSVNITKSQLKKQVEDSVAAAAGMYTSL